ncbi:MAG: helix-turn-helix domain-containing protein [Acidobacteriota bacterium]|nr:helix-turn-helix domain-containing protein [Acidobacteriota bacterium]
MSDSTNATSDPERLLTLEETAEILRLSTWSVRRMVQLKELNALRIGFGKRSVLRVRPSALNEYINSRPTKTEKAKNK